MTYRIKNWLKDFENSESRKIKHARWVPVPNRHDGKGYRRLLKLTNAVEVFAAWCLILQVASKMPVRGVLADDDGPLTAEDLADKTGFPTSIFLNALSILSSREIGWICNDREDSHPDDLPARPDDLRIEGKGREGNRKDPQPPQGGGDGSRSEGSENPTDAEKRPKRSPKGDPLPPGFVRFWSEWPEHDRKLGKAKCARSWERNGLEADVAEILAGLRRWKASDAWTKDGGAFIPLVSTWLNDRRWEASPRPAETRAADTADNGFVRVPVTEEILRVAFGEEDR